MLAMCLDDAEVIGGLYTERYSECRRQDLALVMLPMKSSRHCVHIFAVEVQSEGDYGPQDEQAMSAKRADYFAASSRVVWDVDIQRIQQGLAL